MGLGLLGVDAKKQAVGGKAHQGGYGARLELETVGLVLVGGSVGDELDGLDLPGGGGADGHILDAHVFVGITVELARRCHCLFGRDNKTEGCTRKLIAYAFKSGTWNEFLYLCLGRN